MEKGIMVAGNEKHLLAYQIDKSMKEKFLAKNSSEVKEELT
ncbi:hypothetical protein [Paenisporosarcina antarctica]|nr:hypothetical protein [Paenisporosarcina antarctica]